MAGVTAARGGAGESGVRGVSGWSVFPLVAAAAFLSIPSLGAEPPDWTVNPPDFQATMTVTGALIFDGLRSANADDLVAAFVGEQIRGVAEPLEVGGRMTFYLTVYANGIGETVTFKAYHATSDRVLEIEESLSFVANSITGTVSDPYQWHASPLGGCSIGNPGWTLNASQYPSTMTVTASIATTSGATPGLNDRLAAFAGDELRGVGRPTETAVGTLVFLTVYARVDGETIRFEYYEASTNAVFSVVDSLTFEANAVLGTPGEPLEMTAGCLPVTNVAGYADRLPDLIGEITLYPNPTSGDATVVFGLVVPGEVSIRLFDALGRQQRAYPEVGYPAGEHRRLIDTRGLAAGFYVLRIESDGRGLTRMMSVLR